MTIFGFQSHLRRNKYSRKSIEIYKYGMCILMLAIEKAVLSQKTNQAAETADDAEEMMMKAFAGAAMVVPTLSESLHKFFNKENFDDEE